MSQTTYATLKVIIFIIVIIIIIPRLTLAQSQSQVVINEFLIDPQPQSVELLNIGTESADISNWYIDDNGGTTYFTVPTGTILYPNSCSVFSSDFNLNKSSADTIRLFDQTAPPTSLQALLQDSFSYKSSSGSGITYHRLPDGSDIWSTGSASIGFYNQSGQSCILSPTQTPTPTQTITPPVPSLTLDPTPTVTPIINSPTPTPTQSTFDNIFISEVMVYPNTGDHEWVELYNDNEYSVNLIDWYLDDGENTGSTPRPFSLTIDTKGYNSFELSSSIFNNDMDQVRLLDPSKDQKDSFEYSDPIQGNSLGRISFDGDEFCIQEPTRNLSNSSCINPIPQPTKMTSSQKISSTTLLSNQSINRLTETKPTQITTNNYSGIITSSHIKSSNQGEVLGSQIFSSPVKQSRKLINLLAFNSIFYSLLSLLSLFLKLKNSV